VNEKYFDGGDEPADKYLDPEQNPFIQTHPEGPDVDLIFGEEDDRKRITDDLDVLAPFAVVPGPEATPERIAERLRAAFPDQNEIEIDGKLKIVRTAAGGFMNERSIPLADFPYADLMKISDFLQSRERK